VVAEVEQTLKQKDLVDQVVEELVVKLEALHQLEYLEQLISEEEVVVVMKVHQEMVELVARE
jgi:hypothetical protein